MAVNSLEFGDFELLAAPHNLCDMCDARNINMKLSLHNDQSS